MKHKQINFTDEQRKFLTDLCSECKNNQFCVDCCYHDSCVAIDCFTPENFFETELEAHYFLEVGGRLIL